MFLRVRSPKVLKSILMVSLLITTGARRASADVSTWLGIAPGAAQLHSMGFDRQIVPTLHLGTGMGTDPSHALVGGAMVRFDTFFGHGTDLSFVLRLADHGYANGDWGVALDLGPTARFWGPDSYGGLAVATVGAPWGLEAGLRASFGSEQVASYGCFLGIDLARLTVYRRSGSSWWKNRFPAYRTPEEEMH